MYLGVDIGGTKTLVAALDDSGVIVNENKFETPKDYLNFLSELKVYLKSFDNKDYQAAVIAVPAITIDRANGIASNFGNLPWSKVNIADDVEALVNCPVAIENDAKLAGLSEAMLLRNKYSRVLYLTISTGIGIAFINDLVIDTNAGDAGGKTIMLEHAGKIVDWESFASGKSIAERFGKIAQEINDEKTWRIIVKDILEVLIQLIAIFQPEVVVIGGGVGKYYEKYAKILDEELKKYELPMLKLPKVMGAQRADNAVIYGCYDYARRKFHHG
jgi:glucokinase